VPTLLPVATVNHVSTLKALNSAALEVAEGEKKKSSTRPLAGGTDGPSKISQRGKGDPGGASAGVGRGVNRRGTGSGSGSGSGSAARGVSASGDGGGGASASTPDSAGTKVVATSGPLSGPPAVSLPPLPKEDTIVIVSKKDKKKAKTGKGKNVKNFDFDAEGSSDEEDVLQGDSGV